MNLHLPGPRLLPFTIAALAIVLAMKTVDLARTAHAAFSGPVGGMVSEARAAAPDKPQATTPVPAPPQAATPVPTPPEAATPPVQDTAAPPPVSDGERAILLELRQRRQELDARETALAARESILAAAEQKLAARAEELGGLQKKLQDLEAGRQTREEAGWQGLVKLYEAMKPRDAALIFNDLQMSVLLPLVDRMKEAKAALVLAAMNPDKARDVTAGLAQLRTRRESLGPSAQKGG